MILRRHAGPQDEDRKIIRGDVFVTRNQLRRLYFCRIGDIQRMVEFNPPVRLNGGGNAVSIG